ncbi:hypothetical protein L1887_59688 [Cichorium endivia]|nr:hypothetical protein L1887_59688 [Cichorium endivia]
MWKCARGKRSCARRRRPSTRVCLVGACPSWWCATTASSSRPTSTTSAEARCWRRFVRLARAAFRSVAVWAVFFSLMDGVVLRMDGVRRSDFGRYRASARIAEIDVADSDVGAPAGAAEFGGAVAARWGHLGRPPSAAVHTIRSR